MLEAVAIFVLFKYSGIAIREKKQRVANENSIFPDSGVSGDVSKLTLFMQKLSRYSFGTYLVHLLVIYKLDELFAFNTLSYNPVISIPVMTGLVFVISFLVSFVLHQISIVKKYIV